MSELSEDQDICLSIRFHKEVADRFCKLWNGGRSCEESHVHVALLRAFEGWRLRVSSSGLTSICVRCSTSELKRLFEAAIERVPLAENVRSYLDHEYVLAPGSELVVPPEIAPFVERISIQRPYAYAATSAVLPPPPPVAGHPPRLDVLEDVPRRLRANDVHDQGISGAGVTAAVIDSGFALDHVFFTQRPFLKRVVLAGLASDAALDNFGHGTGVCANLLSVAPGVNFVGVKLHHERVPILSATLLEGFQMAMKSSPRVISISLVSREVYDPTGPVQPVPLTSADEDLAREIRAVADKVVVVVGAGNGQFGFPSQMPEVIAVGGVFASTENQRETLVASDMASAFRSGVYPGRVVPDVCGLVGMMPHGEYITLPVGFGSFYDKLSQGYDGTSADDGWAVFSGTSSAAPQIAGVCALMLEQKKSLTPAQIKKILCDTARDVTTGPTNAGTGSITAGPGIDLATGAGLVDAFAAWKAARAAA